jgi:hypothetical protein
VCVCVCVCKLLRTTYTIYSIVDCVNFARIISYHTKAFDFLNS